MRQRAQRKSPVKQGKAAGRGIRGKSGGVDASTETLYPILFDFTESAGELILRCELPGVSDEKHRVCVEPRRVKICLIQSHAPQAGKRSGPRKDCPGTCLYVLSLPAPVDPAKTTATLSCDMLELRIPRAVEQPVSPDLVRAS
jgi:HSP20 family molecular chaperone IbpA